jgi:hypothetical protein
MGLEKSARTQQKSRRNDGKQIDTRCTRCTDLANISDALYVSICGIFSDAISVWTA